MALEIAREEHITPWDALLKSVRLAAGRVSWVDEQLTQAVRANDGDNHVGATDGPGDDGGVEDVGGEENLGPLRRWGLRRGAVDGADVVTTLRGQGNDMGTDAAGGPEDGELHDEPPDCTD